MIPLERPPLSREIDLRADAVAPEPTLPPAIIEFEQSCEYVAN